MEAVDGNSDPAVPCGSEPCPGLLDIAPFVVKHMQLCNMKALRATCREGRAIVDTTISSLGLDYVQLRETHGSWGRRGAALGVPTWPTVQEFATFVRGILSRGARLQALTLHPVVVGGGGPRRWRAAGRPRERERGVSHASAFTWWRSV